MKYLCIMLLALGVAGCGSTQEPVQPPTAGSVLQVSSGLGEKHPGFEITIPVAQVLHPIPITYAPTRTFFAWRPVSTNVAPRQVRWILLATPEFGNDFMATLEYVRTHPDEATWSPWTDYKPALNEGTFWYSPLLSDGRYVFAVQGRTIKGISDGGFDLGRNVRFLEISHYYDHGPVVRLSGTFFEPFESTGLAPIAISIVPAGAPLRFTWGADASHLGTKVATYRYGWDVADISDDSYWEVPLTAYDGSCVTGPPRTYDFGTHTFSLEVRDDEGNRTLVETKVNVEQGESFNGALDIKPGNCENVLNARSKGRFTAVLAGTPPNEDLDGFDASTVDPQTVVLGGSEFLGAVAPIEAHLADVVTAGVPNFCECLDATPDGRLDLVLTFDTEAVIAGLVPQPHGNSARLLWCFGEMDHPRWGRVPFRTANCVNFVGFAERDGGCRPQGQGSTARVGRGTTAGAP